MTVENAQRLCRTEIIQRILSWWLLLGIGLALPVFNSCSSARETTRPESRYATGYRVQLFQTSDRKEADSIKDLAVLRFQDEVYLIFEPPYYKVRVGDFIDWVQADDMQKLAKQSGFPDAWIVRSRVDLEKIPRSEDQ